MTPMNHRGIRAVFLSGCTLLALSTPVFSQVAGPMGTYTPPRHHHLQGSETRAEQPSPSAPAVAVPAPTPETPPVNVASAAAPPSLLDKPAEPPRIDLAPGRLTIHADNSSLADILHRLTSDSGMTVDGLGGDQRIFGSYGPGDPQEVLSTLLDGSGYNVVMVGRTETGTPRQISLTPRGAAVPSSGTQPPPAGRPGRRQRRRGSAADRATRRPATAGRKNNPGSRTTACALRSRCSRRCSRCASNSNCSSNSSCNQLLLSSKALASA